MIAERAERVLLVVGICCLAWYGLATVEAAFYQRHQRAAIQQLIETPVPANPVSVPAFELRPGGPVGLLEIPRLKLSTPVVEGDDPTALRGAAGHLPDTPRPWERGNSAIAAHRDGLFRPLQNIRIGDEVLVTTPLGEFRYRVRDTRIVKPTDLSVLKSQAADTLTLITCYPFNYVGSAPKRFVVHAERVTGSSQLSAYPSGRVAGDAARNRGSVSTATRTTAQNFSGLRAEGLSPGFPPRRSRFCRLCARPH